MMKRLLERVVLASALAVLPAAVMAQSVASGTISGVVRDASGGVLPGVTVEAASPALIEKVRSVVTDGQGVYRIIDLRPGTYTVTFTLSGFSTFRREGVELTTGFTATVNADLRGRQSAGNDHGLGRGARRRHAERLAAERLLAHGDREPPGGLDGQSLRDAHPRRRSTAAAPRPRTSAAARASFQQGFHDPRRPRRATSSSSATACSSARWSRRETG